MIIVLASSQEVVTGGYMLSALPVCCEEAVFVVGDDVTRASNKAVVHSKLLADVVETWHSEQHEVWVMAGMEDLNVANGADGVLRRAGFQWCSGFNVHDEGVWQAYLTY